MADDWAKKQLGITNKNQNEVWLWLLSLFLGVLIASYWFASISTQQFFTFFGLVLDFSASALIFFLFSIVVVFRRKPALTFLWLGLLFGAIAMKFASGVIS